jgi:type II secretion system protein G
LFPFIQLCFSSVLEGGEFMKKLTQKGFTLIELLVVIAIIGILSAVVLVSLNSARAKSRDARRLSDVRQIMTALEIYYNDNGAYPDESGGAGAEVPTPGSVGPTGTTTTEWQDFLAVWPNAPTPPDGNPSCTAAQNTYVYTARNSDGTDDADNGDPANYRIAFCIGANTGGYTAGVNYASPKGIATTWP